MERVGRLAGPLGLAQHVDEARRDDAARRIDALFCRSLVEPADGDNVSRANTDVRRVPRRARPSTTRPCSIIKS